MKTTSPTYGSVQPGIQKGDTRIEREERMIKARGSREDLSFDLFILLTWVTQEGEKEEGQWPTVNCGDTDMKQDRRYCLLLVGKFTMPRWSLRANILSDACKAAFGLSNASPDIEHPFPQRRPWQDCQACIYKLELRKDWAGATKTTCAYISNLAKLKDFPFVTDFDWYCESQYKKRWIPICRLHYFLFFISLRRIIPSALFENHWKLEGSRTSSGSTESRFRSREKNVGSTPSCLLRSRRGVSLNLRLLVLCSWKYSISEWRSQEGQAKSRKHISGPGVRRTPLTAS